MEKYYGLPYRVLHIELKRNAHPKAGVPSGPGLNKSRDHCVGLVA